MALKQHLDWWETLPNVQPGLPHQGPLDRLELGERVAARLTNENREGWGAWATPKLELHLDKAGADDRPIDSVAAMKRSPWLPRQRRPEPEIEILEIEEDLPVVGDHPVGP